MFVEYIVFVEYSRRHVIIVQLLFIIFFARQSGVHSAREQIVSRYICLVLCLRNKTRHQFIFLLLSYKISNVLYLTLVYLVER